MIAEMETVAVVEQSILDRVLREKRSRGNKRPFSPADIRLMRWRAAYEGVTCRQLAEDYHTDPVTVWKILKGKTHREAAGLEPA